MKRQPTEWDKTFSNHMPDGGGGLVAKSCLTLVTPWTIGYQAPVSIGFPKQEYWSMLPFPSRGDLPYPGIKPISSSLQADSLPLSHQGSPYIW